MIVEYPRHLHGPGGAFLEVHSDDEKAEALADGWSLEPVSDMTVATAAAVPDPPLDPPSEPRKRGRPKKAA